MNNTVKIFLALLVILISIGMERKVAYAYDRFDECEIFINQVIENKSILSLDEPFLASEKRFGFYVTSYTDGSREIVSVHQDLSDELWDENQVNLNNSFIETINGAKVAELSDEEFDQEFESDEIKISVNDHDSHIILKRKTYESIEIEDLVLDLRDVSDIDSKAYQFDANFVAQTTWKDERYLEFAYQIYLEAQKRGGVDTGFFCELPTTLLADENLFVPRLEPKRFMTKRDDIFSKIEFHYTPPSNDLCTDDHYFSECSTDEKVKGIAYFELYRDYLGTINDEFFVEKFPFDHQTLRITFEPDRVANQYYHIDIEETELVEDYLSLAIDRLVNPEWRFLDAWISSSHQVDPASNDFVSTRNFDYEIERRSGYYVYKLMLPIIFLLLLSWSVFFIKIESLESRLTISVISFLSLIAYNFVVDDDLPKLGYLTFIDQFVLLSYVFAGLPTIQTVTVEYLSNRYGPQFPRVLDTQFRKFFLIGYFAMLLVLIHFSEILD